MENEKEATARRLFEDNLLSEKQLAEVSAWQSLGIFSLHNELQFLLYLSVLLFTGGIGVLIYENIDTIGHTVILSILLAVTAVCFYLCFKHSKEFSRTETNFENPVYNYLVLLATILSCIFVGYLQFQYKVFGTNYELATITSSLAAFAAAYYFDNRSALSIAITGLAASIGITVTPKALLNDQFFENQALFYYGIALGIVLILWAEYLERTNFKKHFSVIFIAFAQHLILICCITGLFDRYWPIYAVCLAGATVYLYLKSYPMHSVAVFVFALIYGYIGINVLLFKFVSYLELGDIFSLLTILYPIYVIGSIFLFIRMIKQFNRKTDDSAQ